MGNQRIPTCNEKPQLRIVIFEKQMKKSLLYRKVMILIVGLNGEISGIHFCVIENQRNYSKLGFLIQMLIKQKVKRKFKPIGRFPPEF